MNKIYQLFSCKLFKFIMEEFLEEMEKKNFDCVYSTHKYGMN